MDQDTADALTVIEKQMAEKDQKIADLKETLFQMDADLNKRLLQIEGAALVFVKGLGK